MNIIFSDGKNIALQFEFEIMAGQPERKFLNRGFMGTAEIVTLKCKGSFETPV